MNLIAKNKIFENDKGESVQYKALYLVTENGFEIAIKSVYKDDRRTLLSYATFVNEPATETIGV